MHTALLIVVLGTGCSSTAIGSGGVTDEPDPLVESSANDDSPQMVDSVAASVSPDSSGLAITITRVSDGDSVRADSSEGELEVRLLGINAPEQDECFGPEAAAELERLITNAEVAIHPWPPEVDDFGRELGFLVADGVFVNLSLIETGHVVARAQSDHGFGAEFESAEAAAREGGAGLWARDACGEATEGDLEIVEVFENAPGDDRANPNGEYVTIENVGVVDVDLADWGIRDESTRHRHTFESIVVAPGEQVRLRTGCGELDLGSDPIEAFWCDPEPPVWNNSGDTAFLLDPNGGIADSVAYGG